MSSHTQAIRIQSPLFVTNKRQRLLGWSKNIIFFEEQNDLGLH